MISDFQDAWIIDVGTQLPLIIDVYNHEDDQLNTTEALKILI